MENPIEVYSDDHIEITKEGEYKGRTATVINNNLGDLNEFVTAKLHNNGSLRTISPDYGKIILISYGAFKIIPQL